MGTVRGPDNLETQERAAGKDRAGFFNNATLVRGVWGWGRVA